MDDLKRERYCPSCRMRYRLGPPAEREYGWISVPSATVSVLLSAAREFDETAEKVTPGECYSAVDFVDWLKPSLREDLALPLRLNPTSKKVSA